MAFLKLTLIVWMLALSGLVAAQHVEHSVADTLHVDLSQVKASGSVRPVTRFRKPIWYCRRPTVSIA